MNVNPTSFVSVQSADVADQADANDSDKVVQARFFTAIENGDMETYRELLDHHAIDIGAVNSEGQSFLHVALLSGNTEIAQDLICKLDSSQSLDDLDHRGYTPLMYAVEQCKVDLVKALLNALASPNVSLREQGDAMPQSMPFSRKQLNRDCFPSALQLAVSIAVSTVDPVIAHNAKDMAELLVAEGADVSDALMRSVAMKDVNTARSLIDDFDADPTQAFYNSVVNDQSEASSVLTYAGADVVKVATMAIQSNAPDVLSGLGTHAGYDDLAAAINVVAATGNTGAVSLIFQGSRELYVAALQRAQESGNTATERVLVEAASKSIYHSLREYAQAGVISAWRDLAARNATPSDVEKFERLVDVVRSGDATALNELEKSGVDGKRALVYFAKKGEVDQTMALLRPFPHDKRSERGRVVEIMTAFSVAIEHNQTRLVEALLEFGVNGEAELAHSIKSGDREAAIRLIKLGVIADATLMHEVRVGGTIGRVETTLRLLGANYEKALVIAAQRRDTVAARALVDQRGADVAAVVNFAIDEDLSEGTIDFLLSLKSPISHTVDRA